MKPVLAMKPVLVLLVWGLPVVAHAAGTVYRCQDAKGNTTIQNAPCPPGMRVKGTHAYVPDREPSPQEVQRRRAEEEAQRARVQRHAGTDWIATPTRPGYAPSVPPNPNSREARRQRCLQARKERDDYQFQGGGDAADGMMQHHRKRVQDLCHGF